MAGCDHLKVFSLLENPSALADIDCVHLVFRSSSSCSHAIYLARCWLSSLGDLGLVLRISRFLGTSMSILRCISSGLHGVSGYNGPIPGCDKKRHTLDLPY